MNDTPSTGEGLDPKAVKRYAFKVWNYKMGEIVSLMINLGDRLGLYRAMAGNRPGHLRGVVRSHRTR